MENNDISKENVNQEGSCVSAPASEVETSSNRGDSELQGKHFKEPEPKPPKKKKSKKVKILLWVLAGILLLAAIGTGLFLYYFGGLDTDEEFQEKTESELGIDSSVALELNQKGVTNIALFGVDARDDSDNGRSDTTIILSLDWDHKKIKLTSLARDTYVAIDGYGYDKLCHAYHYGGPQLAIKMINENFNLNISDYVTVNFDQLAAVIDQVDGVTVDISQDEWYYTNQLIRKEEPGTEEIAGYGVVHLNGKQALSYSRIRKNVGGDDARTGRQRKVLEALFNKARSLDLTEYPGLAKSLLPMVKTSLSYMDCIQYAGILLQSGVEMEMTSFPNDNIDISQSGTINGVWYYVYDLDIAADMIHTFIYDDIHPDDYYDALSDTESSDISDETWVSDYQ